MTDLRCLSLHQPWASLVAVGVKTIETRSWPTKHRGRIGIASTKRRPTGGTLGAVFRTNHGGFCLVQRGQAIQPDPVDIDNRPMLLPLGAIVATANLVDCVPMVDGDHMAANEDERYVMLPAEREAWFRTSWGEYDEITDQLPYGVFTPGRWAWLLDDVKPTTERCPACWGQSVFRHECETCVGKSVCDPVPVKGRQRLWRWNP